MGLIDIRGPLAKEIYDLLKADTDISTSVGGRIYDNVPHKTTYPYIEIGQIEMSNVDSHTNESFEGMSELHVWSQYKGTKEANDILDKINKVLHNNVDCFDFLTVIKFSRSFSTAIKDPDGTTIQGIIRYDIKLGG